MRLGIALAAFIAILFFSGCIFFDSQERTARVKLSEKVGDLQPTMQILKSRLEMAGFKEAKFQGDGNEFILVTFRPKDENETRQILSLLGKQGIFEVMLDGNVMFTGDGIISVDQGGGALQLLKLGEGAYEWRLPFTLKTDAAKRFRDTVFHQCRLVSFETAEYDCALTYFYMDRPRNAVLIFSKERFEEDKALVLAGANRLPMETDINEIFLNAGLPYFIASNNALDKGQKEALRGLSRQTKTAIIQAELPAELKKEIESMGFKLKEIKSSDFDKHMAEKIPWICTAINLESVVRLNPELTGNKPHIERLADVKIIQDLVIIGSESSQEEAQRARDETKILLSAGILPVPVESVTLEEPS
ncbi:MAG: hypothetical protein V1493_06570 [Candidatus Diapherotrites archaeon]